METEQYIYSEKMQALKKCNFKIRPAQDSDIDEIVLLHKKEIPSLLARLSIPLIRLYYSNAYLRKELIFRVIFIEEMFGGFYLATNDKDVSHFKILSNRPWRLISRMVSSPYSSFLLFRSFIFKNQLPIEMSKAKLLYFGVSKNHRMKGIGKALINDLILKMIDFGESVLSLHVEGQNIEAINFYKSIGGKVVGKFHRFGRRITIITLKIN